VRAVSRDNPAAYARLVRATELDEDEVEDWEQAASHMFLPYDDDLGIHLQDDSFTDKPIWDFLRTPSDHYPLLLYYHPLNLYRHQVIKQADTILAMFLLSHEFSVEEKRRNFDYYDPLTTHDSSLSVCVQSIIANEIGEHQKALEYFHFAATMDLSDVGGNVKHGAHIASIGGTWLALVYGFGGLRDHGGRLGFEPKLPKMWTGLTFHLEVRGSRLCIEAGHDRTRYTLLQGPAVDLTHRGRNVTLTPDAPVAELAENAEAAE
jgi:alpha,alpha-trehalose phosphorylase